MPLKYEGIIKEHIHTRKYASVFDTCHMGVLNLKGSTAINDVTMLVAGRINCLEEGKCTYGFLLNTKGGILDDLITYRISENEFNLVINAANIKKDIIWIENHRSHKTEFVNLSENISKLDIQGPYSAHVLSKLGVQNLHKLNYYRFRTEKTGGIEFILSRSGYTGELGYELYVKSENTDTLWNLLLESELVKPAGLGARDTLRLEAGYPLYGNELSEDRTPIETGLDRFIRSESDFIGKAALDEKSTNGFPERLIGFRLEERQSARKGDTIFAGSEKIGSVTSGCFAPSLGYAVGMGYIDVGYSTPDTEFEIQVRKKRLKAWCVNLPFYSHGTVRQKVSF